jgi:hypothetical protein
MRRVGIGQRPVQRRLSSQGAHIQTSRSSSVVRMTGMPLGRIGSTGVFGVV